MSSRLHARLRIATHGSRVVQMATLAAFWGVGQLVAQALRLPVPGGVLGLAAALALLATGRLRLDSVKRGANFLLAEMLLFFVPAVMAMLDHREFIGVLGLKLLAVILTGTLCVMIVTALTVDLCARWSLRRGG